VKLAFVDLDHTVLVNPFWRGVFARFAQHVSSHAPTRPHAEAVIDDLMRRSRALTLAHDPAATDWDRLMREAASGFGAAWSEPVVGLVERYVDRTSVVPGAHALLAGLRGAGWTCVGASAGCRRFQLPTLRHLELLDAFDRVLFADDVPSVKRRRAFYGEIAAEVTHVACIGDSYVDDCLYPTHFGFAAIWFTGARTSSFVGCGTAPHAHVARLSDVADALAHVARTAPYRPAAGASSCPRCGGPGEGPERCSLCTCLARREPRDDARPPDRRAL
jgi:FMN phosphatase YigB (HAD superfamily)